MFILNKRIGGPKSKEELLQEKQILEKKINKILEEVPTLKTYKSNIEIYHNLSNQLRKVTAEIESLKS